MSLRSFLTRERSRNRTFFVACGVGFIAYAAWHLWRGNWGVACFLAAFGVLSVTAGALLSEQRINQLATALVLVNVIAAATEIALGVRVQ